jgi:hypothetical protein
MELEFSFLPAFDFLFWMDLESYFNRLLALTQESLLHNFESGSDICSILLFFSFV